MIRVPGKDKDGRRFVLLGFDRENVNRLTAGRPIRVNGNDIGVALDILIVFGETLQSITDELAVAGLIPPKPSRKPDA